MAKSNELMKKFNDAEMQAVMYERIGKHAEAKIWENKALEYMKQAEIEKEKEDNE